MAVFAAIGRACVGAIFGVMCFMAVLPLLVVAFAISAPSAINVWAWGIIGAGAVSAVVAMRMRRALGVLLIELGLCALSLTVSIGLFADWVLAQANVAADPNMAALREALATHVLSWVGAVVGATVGLGCLLVAFFVLRDNGPAAALAPGAVDTSRWSASDRENLERR